MFVKLMSSVHLGESVCIALVPRIRFRRDQLFH